MPPSTGSTAPGDEEASLLLGDLLSQLGMDETARGADGQPVVIDGVYTLTRVIGQGGMALVYEAMVDLDRFDYSALYAYTQVLAATHLERRRLAEAWAQELKRRALAPTAARAAVQAAGIPLPDTRVAVKIALDDEDLLRFAGEWKHLMCLNHPHIIKVYGGGIFHGRPYYAMELVDRLVPTRTVKADFTLAQKLDVILQAGRGLACLHDHGIIHRDVKPGNLLVSEVGHGQYHCRLADLGLAKHTQESLFTLTRHTLGTPVYMAPEQLANAKHVDRRADIYGLSAALYELVTGSFPYQDLADMSELIFAVARGQAPAAPQALWPAIPPTLAAIITHGMAMDAAQRYQQCGELVDDLQQFIASELGGPAAAAEPTPAGDYHFRRQHGHGRPLLPLNALPLRPQSPPVAVLAPAGPPVVLPEQSAADGQQWRLKHTPAPAAAPPVPATLLPPAVAPRPTVPASPWWHAWCPMALRMLAIASAIVAVRTGTLGVITILLGVVCWYTMRDWARLGCTLSMQVMGAFVASVVLLGVYRWSVLPDHPEAALPAAVAKPSTVAPAVTLPADLVPVTAAVYAPLETLAAGSRTAQEAQRAAVARLGLPLEVKTAKTGIAFRLIPSSTLAEGAPTTTAKGPTNETPRQAFYCGSYAVTQGQWQAVMGSNPSKFTTAGKEAPAETVSWNDCQAFGAKLCAMEGVPVGTYRLLSEAEWAYACRAGTTSSSYGPLRDIAWHDENSQQTTHGVGQKTPNAYGLYDLLGNVWQWCGDWHSENPATGCVAKGGSWSSSAGVCRAEERYWGTPEARNSFTGCRLARAIP